MKNLLTFLCVLLGTFCYSQKNFQFSSDGVKQLSAGVYDENEILIRTLFTGKVFPAGNNTYEWDGKDDLGKVAPEGKYSVQLLSNNLKAEWEGTIANTSSQVSNTTWGGSQRHYGYYGAAIDVYEHPNGSVYYATGYSEGNITVKKFLQSDPSKAIYLKKDANTLYTEQSILQGMASTYQITSDGTTLYCTGNTWHSQKVVNGKYSWDNKVFIYAFDLSNDQMKIFSSGKATTLSNYRYPSLIVSDENISSSEMSKYIQTGIAVDAAFLYVAQANLNKIKVYNKSTGAFVTETTKIAKPRRMVSDGRFLWIIYGENSVGKFSVTNGAINSTPVLTLNGLGSPHSLTVANQGGKQYIYVTDGGTDQQVKRYKVVDGSADKGFFAGNNTFGQKGGYVNNSVVTNDRFYFLNQGGRLAGIFARNDGTFWLCDNGNNRMLRYNNSFSVTDSLHWQGATYYLRLVENDSAKLVSFTMQYEIDYAKPLQSSWKLTHQYEPSLKIVLDKHKYFKSLVKLPNGRIYGTLRTGREYSEGGRSGGGWLGVFELTDKGARETGVWLNGLNYTIWPDGSLIKFTNQRGGASTVTKYSLLGFDAQYNPQWSASGSTIAHLNSVGVDGVNGGLIHRPTSDNKLIFFDASAPNNGFEPYGIYNQGFHIGALKIGDSNSEKWLWRTAPANTPSYKGPYPTDGTFEIGNGARMPGGEAVTVSDFIFWNHHGEFWKQGQTNMHHLLYKNGLQLIQFGVAIGNTQNVLPKGYPGMAGNALTIATTRVGDNLYLWHGDEGYHSGVHRWKITGLHTIETLVIPLEEDTINLSANFLANDTSGCSDLAVNFLDQSVVNADSIVSWSWDFGDGSVSNEQNPTHIYGKAGSYDVSLTITSASGASNTFSKKNYVHVSESLSISISGKTLGCALESFSFNSNVEVQEEDKYSWSWDFGNGQTDTTKKPKSQIYEVEGEYTVALTVTDTLGCTGRAESIVTVRSSPEVDAGSDATICEGGSYQLKASGAEKYRWEDVSTLSCTDCATPIASPSEWKQYKVTGYDSVGCSASDLVTVNVRRPNELRIESKKAICLGEVLELAAIGGNQYSWSSSVDLSDPSAAVVTARPQVSTYYRVVAKDDAGCFTDTATVYVEVKSLPVINAGEDISICHGSAARLQAGGGSSYAWETTAALSCTNCDSPMAAPATTTEFVVTGFDNNGCSATDSVQVTVHQPFEVRIAPVPDICIGKSATLSATGAEQYTWLSSSSIANTTSPTTTVTPQTSAQYTVVGKDNVGCFTDTASVQVTVWPYPTVEAGETQTLSVGHTLKLTPTYSADVTSYLWSHPQTLSCANCAFPEAQPKNETTYRVEVTNRGGCRTSDELTVRVICNNGNLFIPNTFSPNQDGRNDRFFPRGSGIDRVKSFKIFNRWGELVFSNENFPVNSPGQGWDGRYKGQILPSDVFVYSCEVVCANNELLTFKGDVTLLR